MIYKMDMEKFWTLLGRILKISQKGCPEYVIFVHFAIYNAKRNPPKIVKCIVKNSVSLFLWGF